MLFMLCFGPRSAQAEPVEMPCRAADDRSEANSHLLPCRLTSDSTTNLSLLEPESDGKLKTGFKSMGVVSQALLMLRKELIRQEEALYRGMRYDPEKSNEESRTRGTPTLSGEIGAVPYCSMRPNALLGIPAETSVNHLDTNPLAMAGLQAAPPNSAQCGEYARVTDYSDSTVKIQNSSPYGKRELAYYRGLIPQALNCSYESVKAELERTPARMFISPACRAMGDDLRTATVSFSNEMRAFSSKLRGARLVKQISNDPCDENSANYGNQIASNGADVGATRQVAMRLCAHRISYVNFFARAAYCEVNARAQELLSEPNTRSLASIAVSVGDQSRTQCASCYSDYDSWGEQVLAFIGGLFGGESPDDIKRRVIQCANGCYHRLLESSLTEEYQKVSPSSGPACRPRAAVEHAPKPVYASLSSAFLFLWSSLFGVRRRRLQTRMIVTAGLIASIASGCNCDGTPQAECEIPTQEQLTALASGSAPAPAAGAAPAPVFFWGDTCGCAWTPTDATCCKPNGTRADDFAERWARGECRGSLAGALDPTFKGIMGAGVLDRSRALANLAEGGAYDSNDRQDISNEEGSTSTGGAQLAATDDLGAGNKTAGKRKEGEKPSLPKFAGGGGANQGKSPGNGDAAGGAGGVPSLAGALHDPLNPGNEDSQKSATTAGTGDSGTGAYKAAGGNQKAGGSSGLGSFGSSGSAAVAGGDGSGTSVDFAGRQANGAEVDALGTGDPDDYFTKISLEGDLFKIVRARYHSTAVRWRGEDSAHAADRATAISR